MWSCHAVNNTVSKFEMQHMYAGNVVQMQSTLHQERLLRQEGEITAAQIGAEKLQLQARLVDLEAKLQVSMPLTHRSFHLHSNHTRI